MTWENLQQAKTALEKKFGTLPRYALILGSGLGGVIDGMTDKEGELPFAEVPNMAAAKVEGHSGRIVVGKIGGVRVTGVQGRLHFYEGHPMAQVVLLVRALALAGVENFVLTNAAGGLNSTLAAADLLLVEDHLNLMPNPLLGPNEARLGVRFPDMSEVYDLKLRRQLKDAAKRAKVDLKSGTYMGITGPTYETPAEVKMYRMLGGDVVGMSTVPEAIALRHMGKKIAAISCVTNLAAGVGEITTHADVLKGAAKAAENLARLLTEAFPLFEKDRS